MFCFAFVRQKLSISNVLLTFPPSRIKTAKSAKSAKAGAAGNITCLKKKSVKLQDTLISFELSSLINLFVFHFLKNIEES
jgi:hypothetical protein